MQDGVVEQHGVLCVGEGAERNTYKFSQMATAGLLLGFMQRITHCLAARQPYPDAMRFAEAAIPF